MMNKIRLLTPGPTAIPESVAASFAKPIIHHRTEAFEAVMAEVRAGLKKLFNTQNEVLLLASTGTGAMDAAVCNLFSPGDKVITVNGGKFGERWTKICQTYGLSPIEIKLESGQAVEPAQISEAIAKNPGVKAVLFQASETSTGTRMPVQEIAAIAYKAGILSVCDAITACGVFPLPMDEWKIDVLMTGSQKALMLPPGLALISLSERAWQAQAQSKLPKFYFNLAEEKKTHVKNQTAWTPAIGLIQGLGEVLKLLEAETYPEVYRRHATLAHATRTAMQALGLEILAAKSPSDAVTAVKVPSQIIANGGGKKIIKLLREKHGITVVGGQDELEGKIIRLSHFGYCDKFDILTVIAGLELVLIELGHPVKLGTGVTAALSVFQKI